MQLEERALVRIKRLEFPKVATISIDLSLIPHFPAGNELRAGRRDTMGKVAGPLLEIRHSLSSLMLP
jgi:hypothetical protein